jgi:2-polyprenyl-3-methyl-5-hydroxy-6-metoxy-1,4-benzoquinol methylase
MHLVNYRLRSLVQPTRPVVERFVAPGYSCLDVGCGMGYFTIPIAMLTGPAGCVTAVDLQARMLEGVRRRAVREGVADRVSVHLVDDPSWVVPKGYDFILAFWMLHEVHARQAFLQTLRGVLAQGRSFLLVEPRIHVGKRQWLDSLTLAQSVGFEMDGEPQVAFSRAAVLK